MFDFCLIVFQIDGVHRRRFALGFVYGSPLLAVLHFIRCETLRILDTPIFRLTVHSRCAKRTIRSEAGTVAAVLLNDQLCHLFKNTFQRIIPFRLSVPFHQQNRLRIESDGQQFAGPIAERLPRRLDDTGAILEPSTVALAKIGSIKGAEFFRRDFVGDQNDGIWFGERRLGNRL